MKRFRAILWLILTLGVLGGPTVDVANAARIHLSPLAPGDCIQDSAGLITEKDKQVIREMGETLWAEKKIPLVVVTINSMAASGWPRGSIESFARTLFEQWGREPDFAYSASWRRGILLVVSNGDRKARIELGPDWEGRYDEQCQRIMDRFMIPEFKEDHLSSGIYRGVAGLVGMCQGVELPIPLWKSLLALVMFMVVLPAIVVVGIYGKKWLDKGRDPVDNAERKIAQLQGTQAAARREHRGRKSDVVDRHGAHGGGGFGGGGGATGSW